MVRHAVTIDAMSARGGVALFWDHMSIDRLMCARHCVRNFGSIRLDSGRLRHSTVTCPELSASVVPRMPYLSPLCHTFSIT